MQICWWEYEQLLEHLRSREDIWHATSSPALWIRMHSYDDETIVASLRITPPKQLGPFRRYAVQIAPEAWSIEQADEYLLHLLRSWTDYGRRQRFETFLRDELQLAPEKATLAAIGLCSLDEGLATGPSTDPDRMPIPTARELYPDVSGPLYNLSDRAQYLRTYGLTGGGWFRIRLAGGMLRVSASLPGHGRYGGGFSSPLEGFVRPYNGNISLTTAELFGEDLIETRPHLRETDEHEQLLESTTGAASGDVGEVEDTGDTPQPE